MANRWQLYRKPQKPEILGTEFLAFVTDFGIYDEWFRCQTKGYLSYF